MPYKNLKVRKNYHRNYMREYNKTHSLTPEQREHKLAYMKRYSKDNSSKIKVYQDKRWATNQGNIRFGRYVQSAKKREIDFNLTTEDFNKLLVMDCEYCRASPANGVDRVNNDLGYYSHNVVACCKTCNYMKRDMSYEQFIAHMIKILDNLE